MSIKTYQIQKKSAKSILAKKLAQQKDVQFIEHLPQIKHYREGKQHLVIKEKKGKVFDVCATISEQYICCNVHVVKSISNCPYDCSYCFLQNYLNDSAMSVISDTQAIIDEIKETTTKQPWRFFRIGNWELGDSLALEAETGSSAELIKAFATEFPNAVLELKTKSAEVDSILSLDHRGRTVVSWSLSPENVTRQEEHKTASMNARIAAMKKAAKAGYLIAMHFDPMIWYDTWVLDYEQLIHHVFREIPASQIAWVSMGSLRFNPEMKAVMQGNFPGSKITQPEMVIGPDGKMRYPKSNRVKQYQHLYQLIKTYQTSPFFVYLCMERWDMWEKIMGYSPQSINHLDYLMAESMQHRFSMMTEIPDLTKYLAI